MSIIKNNIDDKNISYIII